MNKEILFNRKLLSAAILSTCTLTLPSGALAEDSFMIEEIVVTAQKRAQSAQDISVAISAFSGDDVKELGLGTPKDLAAQTPDLSTTNAQSGGMPIFSICGVGLDDFKAHRVPCTARTPLAALSPLFPKSPLKNSRPPFLPTTAASSAPSWMPPSVAHWPTTSRVALQYLLSPRAKAGRKTALRVKSMEKKTEFLSEACWPTSPATTWTFCLTSTAVAIAPPPKCLLPKA